MPDKPRTKRWGLRTLAFLALAAASVIGATILDAYKNNHFIVVTFFGLLIGLVGAGVCTYRGIKAWEGLPKP